MSRDRTPSEYLYIYIYIYMNTYIYIYIHARIHTVFLPDLYATIMHISKHMHSRKDARILRCTYLIFLARGPDSGIPWLLATSVRSGL